MTRALLDNWGALSNCARPSALLIAAATLTALGLYGLWAMVRVHCDGAWADYDAEAL